MLFSPMTPSPTVINLPRLLATLILSALCVRAGTALPRSSSPDAAGVSSTAIQAFIDDVDANITSLHSFMLLRHGQVVAEGWWSPHHPGAQHMLFSLSKSFTSTAVGMAIAEGHLTLDTPIIDIFPADAPAEPSDHLRNMRVRDLLAMNTGHHDDDLRAFSYAGHPGTTMVHDFLHLPVAHKPGTHFLYNTPGSYVLAAAVEKLTGEPLLDYLTPRLFEPLGIDPPHWDRSKDGVAFGGFGLRLATEDIAKFGQLYLQRGEWNGRRLLPAAYVDAATSKQTSNGSNPGSDWDQGYGYQFWRCIPGFFRGDGRFGQYCIIMPEYDAVIAITSGTNDMGSIMKAAWKHLLPGFSSVPQPADPTAQAVLQARLTGLTYPLPLGAASSPVAAEVSGRTYALPANASRFSAISLEFGPDHATFHGTVDGQTHAIAVGYGRWLTGRTSAFQILEGRPMRGTDQDVGAAGAWLDERTFLVRFSLPETTYTPELTLHFNADGSLTATPLVYPLNDGQPFPAVTAPAP